MPIERKVICDDCKRMIHNDNGVAVFGNIHITNDTHKLGMGRSIIGNSNITPDGNVKGVKITTDDIPMSYYHIHCLVALIDVDETYQISMKREPIYDTSH